MGTKIRTNVSKKNPYYLPKHEYLMLRHFCLQYPEWKREKYEIESRVGTGFQNDSKYQSNFTSPVELAHEHSAILSYKLELVEEAARMAGEDLWSYILIGVTTECNYEYLSLMRKMPCCKDVYYKTYRKFFWILSMEIEKILKQIV